jgi:rhodanese-related sulfurtransferase
VSGEGHYDVVSYAGDVAPSDAWADLDRESGAQLVDVRTRPEWAFVGVPDLSPVRKKVILLPWQDYPTMQVNPNFIAELERAVPDKSAPVYFLCRSGARSRAAAIAATEAGYQRCYNVSDGFEGALDGARHRGRAAGWKAAGLPWLQD